MKKKKTKKKKKGYDERVTINNSTHRIDGGDNNGSEWDDESYRSYEKKERKKNKTKQTNLFSAKKCVIFNLFTKFKI